MLLTCIYLHLQDGCTMMHIRWLVVQVSTRSNTAPPHPPRLLRVRKSRDRRPGTNPGLSWIRDCAVPIPRTLTFEACKMRMRMILRVWVTIRHRRARTQRRPRLLLRDARAGHRAADKRLSFTLLACAVGGTGSRATLSMQSWLESLRIFCVAVCA